MVPLKTASVLALLSCAFWRIAGGTAEGMPFVPICGMMGFFVFLWRHLWILRSEQNPASSTTGYVL